MREIAISDETAAHARQGLEYKSGAEPDELALHMASLSQSEVTVRRDSVGGIESHGAGDPRAVAALPPLLRDADLRTGSLAR